MLVHHGNAESFKADDSYGTSVKVLSFCVTWSSKCTKFAERFAKVSHELEGIVKTGRTLADHNTAPQSGKTVAEMHDINAFPVIVAFVDGFRSVRYEGAMNSIADISRWAVRQIPAQVRGRPLGPPWTIHQGRNAGLSSSFIQRDVL
jgi:thiol-disulfide isomerase/thioredoxin